MGRRTPPSLPVPVHLPDLQQLGFHLRRTLRGVTSQLAAVPRLRPPWLWALHSSGNSWTIVRTARRARRSAMACRSWLCPSRTTGCGVTRLVAELDLLTGRRWVSIHDGTIGKPGRCSPARSTACQALDPDRSSSSCPLTPVILLRTSSDPCFCAVTLASQSVQGRASQSVQDTACTLVWTASAA